jgi:hypothetical protein
VGVRGRQAKELETLAAERRLEVDGLRRKVMQLQVGGFARIT